MNKYIATRVTLAATCGFSCIASAQDVFLDDHATDDRVVFRDRGEANYREANLDFDPFGLCVGQPSPCPFPRYPRPYGDRLGYDAVGLFDVNGDGFNDWAATWYHAEPIRAIDGTRRLLDNAVIIPGSAAFTPAMVRAISPPPELVGFCRIFSGKDNTPIGGDIWGGADHDRFAHELAALPDIDGDGDAEVILASNTSGPGARGSLYVFSCTNRYNTDGSTADRWVCILQINGVNGSTEFAYEVEDSFPDFNGDGQVDLMVSSKWWRESGQRKKPDGSNNLRGAGWIFLTPPQSVFTAIQNDAAWPVDPGRPVKAPLVMSASDYSLRVTKPGTTGTSMGDLATGGDIDGDGIDDLVANSGYRIIRRLVQPLDPVGSSSVGTAASTQEITPAVGSQTTTTNIGPVDIVPLALNTTGLYVFLSYNGYNDGGATLANAVPKYNAVANGTPLAHPGFSQIDLEPMRDAEFVIHGDEGRTFGQNNGSIVGVELDNDPADLTNSDMALLHIKPGGGAPFGVVEVMLNLPSRFGPGNPQRLQIETAVAAGQTPVAYPWDQLPGGSEYSLSGSDLGYNVSSVGLAGNFDGEGAQDCELGITVVRFIRDQMPSGKNQNIGMLMVYDFPAPDAMGHRGPAQRLYWVQGEEPQIDLTAPRSGPAIIGVTSNWQGLGSEPGWDQDGDGRDDLVLRATFTPTYITEAPDPSSGGSVIIDPSVDGPYGVDGGASYVVLSPPAKPAVQTIESSVGQPLPSGVRMFTVVATGLVPETVPFDHFGYTSVAFVSDCSLSPASSVPALDVRTTRDPVTGVTVLEADFNSFALVPIQNGFLRIETRWKDSNGVPLCVPAPTLPFTWGPVTPDDSVIWQP